MRTPARHDGGPSPMVIATFVLLLAAFGLQLVAYGNGGHSAISDLPRVFLHRGVGPGSLPYLQRPVEYPVLAGWLLYGASLLRPTPFGVLAVTAVAAGALCVAVTVMLERRFGNRTWRWALGIPVFLYAFQNWDLFAIAALVFGLLAYERGHDRAAGAALGVGAAVKLFPAFVVPPLVAIRWANGDRRGAIKFASNAVGVFLVVNVPVLLANPAGWWWPFSFQSHRETTWGSAWFYLFRVLSLPVHGVSGAHLANMVSVAALLLALVWLVVVTVERHLVAPAAALAGVTIFVLCNKVYSPTYDVWLVVFFVMLPLSRRLWLTFCAVDLAVFALVYGYFAGVEPVPVVRIVLPIVVVVRTAVLLTVVSHAVRRAPVSPTVPSVPEPSRS